MCLPERAGRPGSRTVTGQECEGVGPGWAKPGSAALGGAVVTAVCSDLACCLFNVLLREQ